MKQLFGVITIFCVIQVSSQVEINGKAEYEAGVDALAKKSTLEYGDKCSAEDEKKRIGLGSVLVEFAFYPDQARLPVLISEIKELVESSGQFCNTYKTLQCNSAGVCACGASDALGMRVTTVRRNGVCQLNRGSACAPQESLPTLGGQKQDLRCQAGLECIMKNSTQIKCTEETYKEDIRKFMAGLKTRNTQMVLKALRDKLANGVCICEGEEEEIIEETSTQASESTVKPTPSADSKPVPSADSKPLTGSSDTKLPLVSSALMYLIFVLISYKQLK